MDKLYRIPIPIDHTATTKPRRKAKAKRNGKVRMVIRWAYLVNPPTLNGIGIMDYHTRNEAVRNRLSDLLDGFPCGRIVKLSLPAPAGKGGGT